MICQHFDQIAFLHEKIANKPTESNLSDPLRNSFFEDSVLSPLSPGTLVEVNTEVEKHPRITAWDSHWKNATNY